jgi:hypothetical protein
MFKIALVLAAGTSVAIAQPSITSLGAGSLPLGVTNASGGTYYVGGQRGTVHRWNISGTSVVVTDLGGTGGGGYISADGQFQVGQWLNTAPQVLGNTATGVSPAFSTTPTLVVANNQPATTEFAARHYRSGTNSWLAIGGLPITPSLMVYGSGSSGGSSGNFLSGHRISSTGRFIVGLAYISSYSSSAGTTISANTFTWRPFIWDADANGGAGAFTVLPTPFRTSTSTWRRRTGNAYAVSSDGNVVLGATEHNAGGTGGDSATGVVWRKSLISGEYEMTVLPGTHLSSTPGSMAMNAAGTIIAGRTVFGTDTRIVKWNWNAGTSTWDGPVAIGTGLDAPASWLPGSVTSCGQPPNLGGSIAMSEDGNTIVGSAVYSTCGSFMTGGFIWQDLGGESTFKDWYDHLRDLNVAGVDTGEFYGPIGDNGDPTRGLPVLGYPTAISPDGTAVAGFQFGTQVIPGAPGWILRPAGAGCVDAFVTLNPSATTNFSACSSSIILNAGAAGTAPFTYQWYKDGQPLADGPTASGSTVQGATSFQLRVNAPLSSADQGTYYAVISGSCGSPVNTTNAVVQLDPAFPPAANDTCSGATPISLGTNVLGAGESPCAAYVNDPNSFPTCLSGTTKLDRWYSFTPAASGNYRLETCGANVDTVLTVFADCSGSEVACNDNYATGPTTGCTSSRSRIASVALTGGTTYLVRIAMPNAAFTSSTKLFNLTISVAPPAAPNDACETATPAIVGTNAYNLEEASHSFVASCSTALSRDVFFRFTPTATGNVRLSTCGTTLNTVLSVEANCGFGDIACNDNAGVSGCSNQSIIDLPVNAGVPLFIRVGASTAAAVGAGNLTISTIGCDSIDFNNDGSLFDPQDIESFLSVFSEGPCLPSGAVCSDVDFNNDTSLFDPCDIDSFLLVFSEGPCTPCGV